MSRHPADYPETLTEKCIICGQTHTYTCDPLSTHSEDGHLTCSQECAEEYARIQYQDYLDGKRNEQEAESEMRAQEEDMARYEYEQARAAEDAYVHGGDHP